MLEKIKEYYHNNLWSIDRVWNVVGKVINELEYEEITGFVYPDKYDIVEEQLESVV